ncbi:MAG: UPF0489 family protein [Bacteroidota bacterium]
MVQTHFNILDIDLDFFLNNKHASFSDPKGRLDDKQYIPWNIDDVIKFFDVRCGLNKNNKTSGKCFVHHDEVFYFLRELQEKNDFNLKFSIDHIDAHADLGYGDCSYAYIFSEILFKDLKERSYPNKINGRCGLGKGNFLAFAIACRWVTKLRYINKKEWSEDLPQLLFHDYDITSNFIELKKFTPDMMDLIISYVDIIKKAKETSPLELEPKVPFETIEYSTFQNKIPYDFIFLTHSPNYTPPTSDDLIPIIKEYIYIQ